MFIYLLLFALSLVFAFKNPRKTQYIIPIILCILIFFRGNTVGTDIYDYSRNFVRMRDNPISWNYYIPFDIGFNYVISSFKNFVSENPMDCWGGVGIVYVLGCFSFYKKYAKNANICIFLFVGLGSYLLGYNIMRQCFGLGIYLWIVSAFDLLEKRKWIQLVVFNILIGYFFHSTLYILLLLPIYNKFLYKRNINFYYAIVAILGSLLVSKLDIVMIGIEYIIERTMVEGKLVNYALKNAHEEGGAGYSFFKLLLNSCFCCYTIYTLREIKNIYMFIYLFATCFINLFGNIVLEFARVYELLMVIGLVCISDLFGTNVKTLGKVYIYRYITIIFVLTIYMNILIKNYGEIVPYVFRF